jgi:cytochrome bd-type quinol oxidase subunit 2
LGFLFLGFVGIAISSAGSYLLAAMQTLAIDIFKRKSASVLWNPDLSQDKRREVEQSVLDWVKRMMIPVVVGMTLVFALLYYSLSSINRQGLAFQFQFVMYGAAVTLVPSVLFALFRPTEQSSHGAGFWSICVGLICVFVPFGLAETLWSHVPRMLQALSSDDVVNLTPLFGLMASVIVFAVVRKMEKRYV